MDKLIEQIVLQAPSVVVLLYIMKEQEKRMNALMETVIDCLNSKKTAKKDGTYTYSE